VEISEAYNEWSAQYDTNANKTRDLEKVAAQSILENIEYSSVLELGCGTGKNTEWLSKKSSRFEGLDFSEGMLELARKRVTGDHVNFKKADLTKQWPVENQSADLITCSLVLEHVEDLSHIFREASRVLNTGGHFYICELHPFKQYGGTKARFERKEVTIELQVFIHHLSDYVQPALDSGFRIIDLREWFDDPGSAQRLPRLVSFLFRKN
jgi:ubiquinone/menaquinone biosynthesis C-methylase UbiE